MDTVKDAKVLALSCKSDISNAVNLCEKICLDCNFLCGLFFRNYREKSLWWGIYLDHIMIGVMQITPPSSPLPIYQQGAWPEILDDEDISTSCEFSFIGIDKRYRGEKRLFAKAFTKFYWYARKNNLTHTYAILNRLSARLYRETGQRFTKCGEDRMYWNDLSFPAKLSFNQLEEDLIKYYPSFWKMLQDNMPSRL